MEYKEDIRIQKTKRDLRNAILKLMMEKPIEKISVKEICDTALINRMTFYKYYEDKYQLLDDTFHEIKNDVLSRVPVKEITTFLDATEYCANLLDVVFKGINEKLELILALRKNGNNEIANIITNIAEFAISDLLTELDKIRKFKCSIPLLASFIYGGFLSSINYWLDHPSAKNEEDAKLVIEELRKNVINCDFLFEK